MDIKKHVNALIFSTLLCNVVYGEKTQTPPVQASQQPPQQIVISLPELSSFWASCKEYILGPVVENLVNKRVNAMGIGDLSKVLENKIGAVMAEFIKVGTQAKELTKNKGDKEAIKAHHIAMAELFHTIRPAEATVRGMYPKMTKLFDQLNKLYPDQYTQLDYEIDEKMFVDTAKEVETVFDDHSVTPARRSLGEGESHQTQKAFSEAPVKNEAKTFVVEPVIVKPEIDKQPVTTEKQQEKAEQKEAVSEKQSVTDQPSVTSTQLQPEQTQEKKG